jgi:hypothetical protein
MEFTVGGAEEDRAIQETIALENSVLEKETRSRQKSSQKRDERRTVQMEKAAEQAAKNEENRRRKMVEVRIMRRFQAFPWLEKTIPKPGPKSSLEELVEIEDSQRVEMDLQGATSRISSAIIQGSQVLEMTWGDGSQMSFLPQALRLNLVGLGKVVESQFDKVFQDLILETAIEYPKVGMMSLEMRWMYTIARTLWTVHSANTWGAKMTEMMKEKPMDGNFSGEVGEDK